MSRSSIRHRRRWSLQAPRLLALLSTFIALPRLLIATAAAMLLLAPAALAAPASSGTLTLSGAQTWELVIGALVPLVTYVLNHYAPWASEPVKAFVTGLASAVAGALYQAIFAGRFGFNDATLQMVLTAVLATFAAHKLIWLPSTIAARLGAGTNASRAPAAAPVASEASGPPRQ